MGGGNELRIDFLCTALTILAQRKKSSWWDRLYSEQPALVMRVLQKLESLQGWLLSVLQEDKPG